MPCCVTSSTACESYPHKALRSLDDTSVAPPTTTRAETEGGDALPLLPSLTSLRRIPERERAREGDSNSLAFLLHPIMATLQLAHLNQSLLPSSSASPFAAYTRKTPGRHSSRRLLPIASLPSGPAPTTRREFIFETAAAPLALAALAGAPAPARSEEPALSEWERVYLPIDPGVVLLDIAFVSDDMNHGPSLPLLLRFAI